jgi:hypothetical protein
MHLKIDEQAFADSFAVKPYPVAHNLTDHPLLTVEAIAELADRLPEDRVEHNVAKLAVVHGDRAVERLDQSPGEVARGIETNGCWMVLKNIELDSPYSRLLDECLDEVAPLVSAREGGMGRREGYIFLSAPGSVTPAHFDPEHNFLLQIRGEKHMNIGHFPDAETERDEVEYRHSHDGGRNIDFQPIDAHDYHLTPGAGVYVPVHDPHWVTVPDNVSVSLSITFYTPKVLDYQLLHRINYNLRRVGLKPPPPGTRPSLDRSKVVTVGAVRSVVRRARGRQTARV